MSAEPIAVINSGYSIAFIGTEPISWLLERFPGVGVGSFLYAHPTPTTQTPASQQAEGEREANAIVKLWRRACNEWSAVMAGPTATAPTDFDERCTRARVAEQLAESALRAALSSPQPTDVPEGCTPADAAMLRIGNHGLADQLHEAIEALRGLRDQVHAFAEAHGEAEFYTGRAREVLDNYDDPPAAAWPPQPAVPAEEPSGWKLVPIQPTVELLQKMHLMYWRDHGRTEELSLQWHEGSGPLWEKTYAALLAAAPEPPSTHRQLPQWCDPVREAAIRLRNMLRQPYYEDVVAEALDELDKALSAQAPSEPVRRPLTEAEIIELNAAAAERAEEFTARLEQDRERRQEAPSKPVAWQHDSMDCSLGAAGMHHIISAKVRDLWLKANPKQVEHYTEPLYTHAESDRADDARDAALQAKIDALMLEYCPDEMTPEQLANWAKHQQPIDDDAAIAARQPKGDEQCSG